MTEHQKYDVIDRAGPVEIRRYHPVVFADVHVTADYARAGNIGFGPLVRYISAHSIAMTAPVIQESPGPREWTVSFVMPDGETLDTLPRPAGTNVTLRVVGEELAAALRFAGYTSESRVARKEAELRSALRKSVYEPVGALRIARFDPPWTPGFLRHNEVVLAVGSAGID